jgi:branched-chain amino acid aminotransferase
MVEIKFERIQNSRLPSVDWDQLLFGRTLCDHMFVADYKKGAWQDFRIVPYGPMMVDPAFSALHYGQSIFEGLKAHRGPNGEVFLFRPEANAARLNASAERMCMVPFPEEVFVQAIANLVDVDREWVSSRPGYSLYIRPFMFATESYLGIKASDEYRFMVICSPVGSYYEGAIAVKVETYYTRAVTGGTGMAKASGNYGASLYPAKLAQEKGYRQLIWTDAQTHSHIEESGTMNLFALINETLYTPSLSSGTILPGITRDSVITLAKHWGRNVVEGPISVEFIQRAIQNKELTELFGAGTAATIAQIHTIHIEGVDYTLNPVENRIFSNRVSQHLNDMKRGAVEDLFGWIYTV